MSSRRATPPARERGAERAFTLIELLVAIVLLAVAGGIVVTVIVQGIAGAGGGRSGALSDAALARASTALRDDIANAQTQDRIDARLRDPNDFAASLRTNAPAYSTDQSDAGAPLDIDDVVLATPTELRLRVDVGAPKGVECVTWRATTSGGTYRLERLVAAGAGCGGAGLGRTTMLSATTAVAGVVTAPFSYQLMCNPADCPGAAAPASAPCRPWNVTNVPTQRRRWVVGVSASFTANSTNPKAVASTDGTVTAALRSRDTEQYRAGLGC